MSYLFSHVVSGVAADGWAPLLLGELRLKWYLISGTAYIGNQYAMGYVYVLRTSKILNQ